MTVVRNTVLRGDATNQLRRLPSNAIDMVLTSPPYFRLRDYGVSAQLGTEGEVGPWVDQLLQVSREVKRVLTPTGTYWLNLGDTYATHGNQGAGRKSLLLGPERLALRLIADGWIIRNKVTWRKANPMPTSVRDRLACTWEVIYVLAKSPHYFFDLDAIRVPHTSAPAKRHHVTSLVHGRDSWHGPNSASRSGLGAIKEDGRVGHPLGKNPGDVWTIASSNYRGGHRATFPVRLAERAILAGCPEARCSTCLLPWRRQTDRAVGGALSSTCACPPDPQAGIVLDPFFGAGTTGLAASRLNRNWLGIELNPAYVELARARVAAETGLVRAA